ncbi:Acetylserotonin O-methyltransferase [Coccomyxa sp. Obi]|nr:Acetylserotonin O-methyltransferase [Coccomyxa sp. Obi]
MSVDWQERDLLRDWSNPPPWPIFLIGKWLITLLRFFLQWIQPPPLTIFDIQRGAWQTQILYTLANLGIPDELGRSGPQTAEQLAHSLGLNSQRLYRVLRSAVQMGILTAIRPKQKGEPPRFKNNRLSAVLREDHPNCLRQMILHQTDHNKLAWDELVWAVRTGGNPFKKTHDGLSEFEWLKLDPKEEDKFSKAMKQVDSMGTNAMATDYDWNRHARIVDIGGAYGSFLAHLLTLNQQPRGVLFDQPQVIQRAKEMWAENAHWSTLSYRMEFAEGDFFKPETMPKAMDGDVFIMRLILHDWDDKDSVAILSSIRRAMGTANAKLLIIETTIGDEFFDPLFQRAIFDVHMMVALNGVERTVTQWTDLLRTAGFSFVRNIQTRSVFTIVEAIPA